MRRVLPILFNTEMVEAIMRQTKTVTRRTVKGFIPNDAVWGYTIFTPKGRISCCGTFADGYGEKFFKLPYMPEDILYVRETWRVGAWDIQNQMIAFDYKDGTCGGLVHIDNRELFERLVYQSREDARKAHCEYNGADFIWRKGESPCRGRTSIHMPKEAARIWLKVTDVRVERLQDITHIDIIMEGVEPEYLNVHSGEKTRDDFAGLWDSTIDKTKLDLYGWKANPWVWVIEFERCEKPEPCILKGMEPAEDKRPCIGYGDEWADEPCEMCKGCRQCTGNNED